MSAANHREFTYRRWRVATSVVAVVIFLFAASPNIDAAPTSPGIPVTVKGTKLLVRRVIGGLDGPKGGFRLVVVVVEIKQGASPDDVVNWKVTLRDANARVYGFHAAFSSRGPSLDVQGERFVLGRGGGLAWMFYVPNEAKRLWLVFPGGVSVDLAPLMRDK